MAKNGLCNSGRGHGSGTAVPPIAQSKHFRVASSQALSGGNRSDGCLITCSSRVFAQRIPGQGEGGLRLFAPGPFPVLTAARRVLILFGVSQRPPWQMDANAGTPVPNMLALGSATTRCRGISLVFLICRLTSSGTEASAHCRGFALNGGRWCSLTPEGRDPVLGSEIGSKQ